MYEIDTTRYHYSLHRVTSFRFYTRVQVSNKMASSDGDLDKLMVKMEQIQTKLDACDGWELDRQVEVRIQNISFVKPDTDVTLVNRERSKPSAALRPKPSLQIWAAEKSDELRFASYCCRYDDLPTWDVNLKFGMDTHPYFWF